MILSFVRMNWEEVDCMDKVLQLNQLIDQSDNIVFFGGAGVSTESGIPDFRSTDGLYNQKYQYPPEQILSHTFFEKKPSGFFAFYRDRVLALDAKPNAAHKKLTELEKAGKLKAIITQNIDGLHQAAGSHCVFELHGSVHRNYCMNCGKFFPASYVKSAPDIPICECGGIIKPDVVLYEESLNQTTLEKAVSYIRNCELLIIGGTSLVVYPAAGLIDYFRGDHLIVVNKTEIGNRKADLFIKGSIGEVFSDIKIRS